MPVHQNSIEAYEAIRDNLGGRRKQIYSWLLKYGDATDREIKKGLNLEDMNMVRPRITELIEAGTLFDRGSLIDVVTKRKVRLISIRKK